jgi:hypothetical protein
MLRLARTIPCTACAGRDGQGDGRKAHGSHRGRTGAAHRPSGKAIYGAPLGILMLEAPFPRTPGDMGNAGTWPFPVLYPVVSGASPERVVLQGARGLLPDFIAAAREPVRLGAWSAPTCRPMRSGQCGHQTAGL